MQITTSPATGSWRSIPRVSTSPPPTADWFDPDDFAGSDTRRVFVNSNAIDDTGNGLSPTTPKKLFESGRALCRPGFPDQLLLICGGVWTIVNTWWTTTGLTSGQVLSGRNANERMVLGHYGTGALPSLQSGIKSTIKAINNAPLHDFAVLGVDLDPDGWTPGLDAGGIDILKDCSNIFVENTRFREAGFGFRTSFQTAPTRSNVILRRNNFQDAGGTAHVNLYKVDGYSVIENHIDNMSPTTSANGYASHAIKAASNCTGGSVLNNVLSRAANKAVWMAGGGTCDGNVSIQCGGGVQVGNSYDAANSEHAREGGVPVLARDNLALELRDINGTSGATMQGGEVVRLENISGGEASGNIGSQSTIAPVSGATAAAIYISGLGNTNIATPCSVRNLLVKRNRMVRWAGTTAFPRSVEILGNATRIQNLTLDRNDFQEPVITAGYLGMVGDSGAYPQIHSTFNRFWRGNGTANAFLLAGNATSFSSWQALLADTTSAVAQISYPFALRTIGNYNAANGGLSTTADFIARCRLQERSNWDNRLMAAPIVAYFQSNFNA